MEYGKDLFIGNNTAVKALEFLAAILPAYLSDYRKVYKTFITYNLQRN